MKKRGRTDEAKALGGGDLRSIGRANQAARMAAGSPARFASLFDAMFGDDPVVAARAADACEKASRANRSLLRPHKKNFMRALPKAAQQEVRWHLCQMLPRLSLTAAERRKASAALKTWFAKDESRIVRVMALQAFADLAKGAPPLRDEAEAMMERALSSGVPSLAARARKLIKEAKGAPRKKAKAIVQELRRHAVPGNLAGMARYGIETKSALGVTAPVMRAIAKEAGRDHAVAQALWAAGLRETRIVAALVDEPAKVTPEQMERWAAAFDSWDVCDGVCCTLFDKTPHAWEKAVAWSAGRREYVKRAGFVLMAALAVHDKRADDVRFLSFLPLVEKGAGDERNFVKKAVNWALRQIGKRSRMLRDAAIPLAARLAAHPGTAPRWVGHDALRELKAYIPRR